MAKAITKDYLLANLRNYDSVIAANKYVAKETGKGLSANDFTDAYKTKLDGLENYDATSLTSRVETAEGKITTLIGDDSSKSVRTIANEELAKQLIPENATESLDTLGEIAAWIQSHPTDASAYNAAINKLATGYITDGVVSKSVAEIAQDVLDNSVETTNIDFTTEWEVAKDGE